MKSKVSCVVLLCVLWGTAFGQTPHAIDCEANAACVALGEQAQQQSKAGQLAEAEKSYKMAYEVSHDPRLLYPIARVLDKQGQGPEAMNYYRQFIEAPIEDAEEKEKARGYLAQLEAKNAPPPKRVTAETPIQPAPLMTESVAPKTEPVVPKTEQKDTPVYKKGWFWGVMIGSVAAVGLGIGLGVGLSNRSPTAPNGTNSFEPTF